MAKLTADSPPPGFGTDYGLGGHRFNDDLLLSKEAQERAQREYQGVFHILDYERLREAFRRKNNAANRAKRESHVAGFWAVVAALAALAGASSEPLWGHISTPWPRVIAISSATLGLVSFLVAIVGLAYGKRKFAWLHSRLYTERLRQFHFQTFVWRLPEIVESLKSSGDPQNEYMAIRDQWFDTFEDEFKGKADAQLSAILHPTAVPVIWLHPDASNTGEPSVPDLGGVDIASIFRAYETFRFDEQIGYAEFMLRTSNMTDLPNENTDYSRRTQWQWYPGINLPLRSKLKWLNNLWIVALTMLVLLHLGVLVSHFWDLHLLEAVWIHVAVVTAALLAVAAKTLSEGFALSREIERYEEYLSIVSGLKQAFRAAESPRKRLQIMMEMERASFEEMRVFLRSHYEATFIM